MTIRVLDNDAAAIVGGGVVVVVVVSHMHLRSCTSNHHTMVSPTVVTVHVVTMYNSPNDCFDRISVVIVIAEIHPRRTKSSNH
jgi:hypothetical protein